ncbi:uncharacterized protein [Dermacentor albipictus]|uniref:uncharacterized protein isoform X2 n=1 Tax=Dermacentor albipictus TaxID=60249 RepID=UPI0038FCB469
MTTSPGYINNLHVKSDNANPYEVKEVSNTILFGQTNWHKVETLEIHWVAWSSAHNKSSNPSLLDQLFVPDQYGEYHYQHYDIFHVRTGSVITVLTKFQQNTNPKKRDTGFYKAKPWVIHGSEVPALTWLRWCVCLIECMFLNSCLNGCCSSCIT